MSHSKTFNYISGLFTGYTFTIATVFIGLLQTPVVLHYLDRDAYAIFALGSDTITWLMLFDVGISSGLNVYLARRSDWSSTEEINRLTSSAFFAQLSMSLLMFLFGIFIALRFPYFFDVSSELKTDSIYLMTLLVTGATFTLAARTFSAILIAYQQIYLDNLIKVAMLIIRTVLMVILLQSGMGLLSLGISSLLAMILTSAFAVIRAYRLIDGLSIKFSLVSLNTLKSVGNIGIWFSLGGVAGLIILNLDRIVAGKLVSLEAVTIFVLTGRLYSFAQGPLDQITNTVRPMLGQLLGQGKKAEALTIYRSIFKLSNGLAIVVSLAIWAGNREFIRAWVGIENYGGITLDTAFLLNVLVNTWILPNRAVLSSALIVKPQTLSRIVEGALNIGLAVLLTRQFGLVGVALSTFIAAALTSLWYLPILTARLFDTTLYDLWFKDSSRLVILSLFLLPISLICHSLAEHLGGIAGVLVAGSLTGGIGLILLWFVVFDDLLRNRILKLIPGENILKRILVNLSK